MRTLIIFAMLAIAVHAAALAATEEPPAKQPSKFHFNFLPKAFQKNPRLEMTVVTEMTAFGRTLPFASPEQPVRYISHDRGGASLGAAMAGERKPPKEKLDAVLRESLAERGYLPYEEGGDPPALVLILHWGSHYRLDFDLIRMFPELHRQHNLERAMLVGGHAYMKQAWRQINSGPMPGDRAFKMGQLYYQAHTDLYYVVVSAYDHDSVASNQPKLAWRTLMTVNAVGVSMSETIPPLILTASNYFGSEMSEPAVLLRNVRRGTVTMGPLRVIGEVKENEPAPK